MVYVRPLIDTAKVLIFDVEEWNQDEAVHGVAFDIVVFADHILFVGAVLAQVDG